MLAPANSTDNFHITLSGVPRGAEGLALAHLLAGHIGHLGKPKTIIHTCVSDRAMDALHQAMPFFAQGVEIIKFPAWDCLPYDRASPRPSLVAERVRALATLAAYDGTRPLLVLTTANAVLQKLPPKALMQLAVLEVAPKNNVRRERLEAFLQTNGYRRAGKAVEPGEFALRGSIVDIVPAGESAGVRLDFFGDELESIRAFDPLTQISTEKRERFTLLPVSEILFSPGRIDRFRAEYRAQFGAAQREDFLYEAISNGMHYPGMEHWLPLFYESLDTLHSYLPDATLTFDYQSDAAIAERHEAIRDYFTARQLALQEKRFEGGVYHPLAPEKLYMMSDAWQQALEQRHCAWFTPFASEGERPAVSLNYRASVNLAAVRRTEASDINPFEQLRLHANDMRAQGKVTLLACLSAGSRERIMHLLQEREAHTLRIDEWNDAPRISGKSIGLAVLPLEHGFETENLALITEQDLLGEKIIRAKPKKKTSDVFLAEAANFSEGELVVHREHGIGRFAGLITLEAAGAKHDCLKLIYADDDKLFLPVENIELVSRFGSEEEGVRLDKLGGASWQARKARMKQRIKLAAAALIETAAARQVKSGPVLECAGNDYEAFCAGFPYAETEDQDRSISEVLEDVVEGRPMDRLICGDVGFGKTEVALRAAFVAVHSAPKVQVAVVVPTTLLARQHYKNFAERFANFNVTVRQLSRMVPAKQQKETRELLEKGDVDIVVGTHAVLAKHIKFANLGLVIVDEEQHFGVAQKERLKELRSDVHVLTLSATPIPRTLQMALSGVRSLSLITTPPVDRLAVRSFVMPYDPVVLREAILREQHRGGRVFFVTQRIKDLAELKVKLAELVPEVKVAVAHGQMPPSELDGIMNDFYDGKYDLLLSTAIVESGLDIPTANTMIIHRADRFGLSQLYQLRGRVGRGKLRAYAYFLLPSGKELTKNATRRLEVMQSLDTLGAGFTLASHDMDIRGFGNLVGEEQSGHIREVGIELYQQMLEDAINNLKTRANLQDESETPDTDWSPQINLGMSVLIPEEYVADLQLRLGLYRRAGSLADAAELDAFAAELVDRFGALPSEVEQLLATVRLKQLCKAACIERIDAGPKGAVLSFRNNVFSAPEKLLAYIARHPTTLKLRPDQKLVYTREWKAPADKMKALKQLLADISGLA